MVLPNEAEDFVLARWWSLPRESFTDGECHRPRQRPQPSLDVACMTNEGLVGR